jgi:hypothetical protein
VWVKLGENLDDRLSCCVSQGERDEHLDEG